MTCDHLSVTLLLVLFSDDVLRVMVQTFGIFICLIMTKNYTNYQTTPEQDPELYDPKQKPHNALGLNLAQNRSPSLQ